MVSPRTVLAALLVWCTAAPVVVGADSDGVLGRKSRIDPARVRFLADLLRTEQDEKKRRAAVLELADADPRTDPEVMPTLLGVLKRDAASVRATAAEVIGRFKAVFPLAGAALESAAESDPTPSVRDAAKQALWEYHLNGYRSTKDAHAQTAEPPLALPGYPRAPGTRAPSSPVSLEPAPAIPSLSPLPPIPVPPVIVEPLSGPRVQALGKWTGPRELVSHTANRPGSPDEPPLAKRSATTPPLATVETEPPIVLQRPDVSVYGKRPTVYMELPPIVPPPGPLPGVVPFPDPTGEPPLRRTAAR